MHIRIYRYIMRSNLFVFLFFLHLHQHSFGFAMVLTCFDPYPYRPCQCSMIQPGKDRAVAAAIHHSHLCRECRGLNMFHQKKKYREPDSIEIQASLVSNESFVNNACTKKMLVVHNYSL